MQIKTAMRYPLIPIRMAIIKKNYKQLMLERIWRKRNPSTLVGMLNWYSHYAELYGVSLKKLETELPYDPAIPLLDIYTEKILIQKDTCNPVFTAALFITVKTWKQPKCPSTDEWIKKMWCIYTLKYYSAIKRIK